MATHKSAEKRARQTLRRNAHNRSRRAHVRTMVKTAEAAMTAGDAEQIVKTHRAAESALAKAGARRLIHGRTAARKASRLAKRVKAAQTAQTTAKTEPTKPAAKTAKPAAKTAKTGAKAK
jgi:small subunit ribosomal protein S20